MCCDFVELLVLCLSTLDFDVDFDSPRQDEMMLDFPNAVEQVKKSSPGIDIHVVAPTTPATEPSKSDPVTCGYTRPHIVKQSVASLPR